MNELDTETFLVNFFSYTETYQEINILMNWIIRHLDDKKYIEIKTIQHYEGYIVS
jgi:hypothetical protein